jgi:hypothetical protein
MQLVEMFRGIAGEIVLCLVWASIAFIVVLSILLICITTCFINTF